MSRANVSAARRRAWHEKRMKTASTLRGQLWAACSWLVAEAWRAGDDAITDATDLVVGRVHEIRGEDSHGRRY